jgi:hypothetical protein
MIDFGAAAAMIGILLLVLINPTAADARRLDAVAQQMDSLPKTTPPPTRLAVADTAQLMQQPIFTMSVGANAYKDKAVKLFGVSVTPNRRAALVSIDGQEPVWMSVGEAEGDLILLDVGGAGVRFDTPVGPRTVTFQ